MSNGYMRRTAACRVGLISLVLIIVFLTGQCVALFTERSVKVVGSLPRKDVVEICRVVRRAEYSMETVQFPPGLPALSWQRVRLLPTLNGA